MPELGFGAFTEDLKILSDDSPAPEVSSPAPETESTPEPAPEITPSEPQIETTELAQPIGPEERINEAEFFKAYPQYKETFLTLKKNLAEHQKIFGTVREAREFKNQLQALGGLEKIKELKAHAERIDAVDKVYYGGNAEEKRQFLTNLQQQNPQAFFSNVMNGLALIKQANPEDYAYIVGPFVAEQLREANIWAWLEHIHNEMAGKPELAEASRLLNQFAAGLSRKYGLGPSRQDTPEVAQQRHEFHAEIGRACGEPLDQDIVRAIAHFAPHVSFDQQLQEEIIHQAHLELQNAMKGNRHLRHALENVLSRGMSRAVGNRAASLLASRLRAYVPYIIHKLTKGIAPPTTPPPATNGKAAPSRNGTSARKPKLSQREANQMTFAEIIGDPREGEAIQPRQLDDVFDEAAR